MALAVSVALSLGIATTACSADSSDVAATTTVVGSAETTYPIDPDATANSGSVDRKVAENAIL